MKKSSLLFGLLTLLPLTAESAENVFNNSESFVIARATKLGRGKVGSISGAAQVNNGSNGGLKNECSTNTDCDNGYRCYNGKCVDVCGNAPCSSNKDGQTTCEANGHDFSCVCTPRDASAGTTTTCSTGKTCDTSIGKCRVCNAGEDCDTCTGTKVGDGSGGCQCASGYRRDTNYTSQLKCVAMCDSVTCVSGSHTVATATGCSCEPDVSVSCIPNCGTCNQTTGVCSACESGYTEVKNAAMQIVGCVKIATKSCIDNCGTCNILTGVCTACADGYIAVSDLTTGTITACNATLVKDPEPVDSCSLWDNSRSSGCSPGYRKPAAGGSCVACPANTQCASCKMGCSGSTAGSCATNGYTCLMCNAEIALTDEKCTWSDGSGWNCY